MATWSPLAFLFAAFCLAVADDKITTKEHTICDPEYNSTFKIQCLCDKDSKLQIIKSAECYVTTDNLNPEDPYWDNFHILKNVTKLILSNARGKSLKYVPTKGLWHTDALNKIDVKYNMIPRVESYAFANMTQLKEILMRDNKIEVLEGNAFAHLKKLTTIVLDKNNIAEINRNVFVDLPRLQKLYLTSNVITTIHDRAFIDLNNLKILEINNNALFSLNSETFSGLVNLEILDLSGNSLEVIGDNTFLPLKNLRSLNLEGNKIQMIDDKAFNGLGKLQSLTLASNKLTSMESVKVLEGLRELIALSLRDNQLRELKVEVMAPILSNFYSSNSTLDIEGNNFPCDCRLDWLMDLMNKTRNKNLQLAIDNLKCIPDTKTKDLYTKFTEAEVKNQIAEDDQAQNNDYEYYDESQLNGKLFYIDLRAMLNCTGSSPLKSTKESSHDNIKLSITTQSKENKILNNGLLDKKAKNEMGTELNNKNEADSNKPNLYTTSRLATVSAKPVAVKKLYDEREMAADEAKPDALKDQNNREKEETTDSAQRNAGCAATLVAVALVFRLLY